MALLYIFAVIVIINCAYYLLFSRFSFSQPSEFKANHTFPVSVIVCAKNEAKNLQENIPYILAQDHPDFELILINDSSSDDTQDVMEAFSEEDKRIQVVNVKKNENFWSNKKYALTLGIKRAKNSKLIFTDADCKPATTMWLSKLVENFSEEKQIVLGYGAYEKSKGFLNKLIRYETLLTATQYFAYAKVGNPYMGVGRNLAYTTELYYENRGFILHIKLPSGDDDLFINETANNKNTALEYSPISFTYSQPKKTFKAWKIQKKRHITTSKFYKPKDKFLLGLYYIANLLFWPLAILALFITDWRIVICLILFRIVMQYLVLSKAAKLLKENDLIALLPVYDLFLVGVQMSIFISNLRSKPTRWK